jgi:hypothetical protein
MADIFEDKPGENIPAYEELVGDGKKFKTNEDVAKKIFHSDKHISELERELEELRTELRSRSNLEDMLKDLKTGEQTPTPLEPGQEAKPEVNIKEEVKKLLSEQKSQEQLEANVSVVRDGLKQRFGDDYNNHLLAIAKELNVSVDFLRDVGVKSPSGFFKLIDSVKASGPMKSNTPPQSRVDAAHNLDTNSVHNRRYYRELKQKDRNLYFSARVQRQMYEDAMRMGSEFDK